MGKGYWKFRQSARAARDAGGWARFMGRQVAVYVPRGTSLLVSFDTMGARDLPAPRMPWAHSFAEKAGYSHLGVMMNGDDDWFRRRALFDFFDERRDIGFFDQFQRVVFYGSSMGGFAATTFCAAAPGCHVVAFSPQSTLMPARVPFERRYDAACGRGNWDDPRYCDAATALQLADSATLFVDPYHAIDARHLARLPGPRVTLRPCAFMGHRIPMLLSGLKGFSKIMRHAVDGTLDTARWHGFLAARHKTPAYHRQLARIALNRGHPVLAGRVLAHAERLPRPVSFPKLEAALGDALQGSMIRAGKPHPAFSTRLQRQSAAG